MGKGDKSRVKDQKRYEDNYDHIFRKDGRTPPKIVLASETRKAEKLAKQWPPEVMQLTPEQEAVPEQVAFEDRMGDVHDGLTGKKPAPAPVSKPQGKSRLDRFLNMFRSE